MPKRWSLTSAFESFGATPVNARWSWSARSPDGKTVVVTLWQDQVGRRDGRLTYESRGESQWKNRPGSRERIENLAWARDQCGGRFNVVIVKAVDPKAEPRSIQECFPSKLVMRLTHLDVTGGAWAAEAEGPENA